MSLAASQASAAAPEPGAPPPHTLVVVAESILEKKHPEAADVVVRLAVAAPGLTAGDRIRLHMLQAMLCQAASNDLCARKEINEALNLDRAAACPPFASPQFQRVLEDARAVFPRMAQAPPPASTAEVSLREPAAQSLAKAFDALYVAQEFEGADVTLQLAKRYEPLPPADRVQLLLRRGILQMEAFDEAGARRSLQEALDLDRAARLPRYAPPGTLRLFEEARVALPPEVARKPALVERPPAAPRDSPRGPRPLTWIVAGGGVVLAGTGGVLYLSARSSYDLLANRDPSIATAAQLQQTADNGRALQTTAFVLAGVGTAAVASGLALHFFGDSVGLTASVQASPGTVGLGFAGVLP